MTTLPKLPNVEIRDAGTAKGRGTTRNSADFRPTTASRRGKIANKVPVCTKTPKHPFYSPSQCCGPAMGPACIRPNLRHRRHRYRGSKSGKGSGHDCRVKVLLGVIDRQTRATLLGGAAPDSAMILACATAEGRCRKPSSSLGGGGGAEKPRPSLLAARRATSVRSCPSHKGTIELPHSVATVVNDGKRSKLANGCYSRHAGQRSCGPNSKPGSQYGPKLELGVCDAKHPSLDSRPHSSNAIFSLWETASC